MTDKDTSTSDGLPKLDSTENGSNKKPPLVFIVFILALMGGVAAGIQYAINYYGIFDNKQPVIQEPPVPDILQNVISTPLGNDLPLSAPDLNPEPPGDSQPSGVSTGITSEQLSDISKSLVILAEEVGAIRGELSQQRESVNKVMGYQSDLVTKFEVEVTRHKVAEEKLSRKINESQRWLNGISNQLQEIGVDVKEASQDFPVVVYGRSIWGDDIFLTVALKEAPDHPSFLHVGGVIGHWRLIKITDNSAIFEHFEGNKKEVML